MESGLPPFVRLREYSGQVYSAAADFLAQVTALAAEPRRGRDACAQNPSRFGDDSIRPLADFHADRRYRGDLHRADMAWALYAASRGLSEQQIRYEILHARDLSKKGGASSQLDYADRTAIKAITSVQPLR